MALQLRKPKDEAGSTGPEITFGQASALGRLMEKDGRDAYVYAMLLDNQELRVVTTPHGRMDEYRVQTNGNEILVGSTPPSSDYKKADRVFGAGIIVGLLGLPMAGLAVLLGDTNGNGWLALLALVFVLVGIVVGVVGWLLTNENSPDPSEGTAQDRGKWLRYPDGMRLSPENLGPWVPGEWARFKRFYGE